MDDSGYVCTVRKSFKGSKQSQHLTITGLRVCAILKDRIKLHYYLQKQIFPSYLSSELHSKANL